MFGSSSPFGQSATAPFGSQSPFGQNNATTNPFGVTNPFGSQTGGSIFGSTSTGVFGQSSSPLSSTPAFGAASSPAFGTSTPTFGSQSSSFGGSSAFGQKSFGVFGTSTQTSPFGNSAQQSQSAFGSNMFGSTAPFGAPTQPSFGGTNTPAFGSSTTPSFGATSAAAPAFGSTPTPSFGSTGATFGVGSSPAFGSPGAFGSANASAFGSNTSAFGTTSTPSFGVASTPAFGQSNNQAFGGSSTPSFGFNSNPAFGQSTPSYGNPGFGSAASTFGIQGSSGAQTTTPVFGSGALGQSNLGGSRVTPYLATADADGTSNQQGKLGSISAMQAYKEKSHEELRWEDYQRGDKGGPNAASQSTSVLSSGVPGAVSNHFGNSQTFGQSSASPFSVSMPSTQTNVFGQSSASTGLGTTTATFGSSPFGSASATTPSLFGQAQTPSPFGASNSAFASSPSVFGTASSAAASPSLFAPTQVQGQSPFGTTAFGNQTSTSLGIGSGSAQTSSPFGQTPTFSSAFNTTSNSFATSGFPNSTFASGGQLNFGQSTPSLAPSFQPSLPSQPNSPFNISNFVGGAPGSFGQNLGQPSANQSSTVLQPVAITNPFGTLPAMPHMSIGNVGMSPSIQYGISSMPVVDKPAPVRVSSLLTSRHLSQRRIRLPARKYNPKNDGSRVAFFSEEDESPSTPKADALFIPRENPRALIIRPIDQWPKSYRKDASVLVCENGKTSVETQHHTNGSIAEGDNGIANGNGSIKHQSNSVKISQKPTDHSDEAPNQKGDSYSTLSGHRAGEAAIVYEHGANIEATMPKLRHSDYYTEPQIQELAAKERAEPGYCKHVKDFVVGRRGYGSIKFLGETDVRGLDVESVIQFNDREVIVYLDDSKKPPVGQGLNKPAEVTLLNIKFNDRKTGKQIVEGPKFEKYKEMLKNKAEDQGAEYLSYDPAKAEWKFRVSHFSKYSLCDNDSWDTPSNVDAI